MQYFISCYQVSSEQVMKNFIFLKSIFNVMLIELYIMQLCKRSIVFLFDLTRKCITGSSRLHRSYL